MTVEPNAQDVTPPRSVEESPPPPRRKLTFSVPAMLVVAVVAILGTGATLFRHASAQTNHSALAASPKGVTAVIAKGAEFRESRRYVGTLAPWLEARVGPQLVSAYVSEVLVRPGTTVKKDQVLATLDCRNSSAANRVVTLQAQALAAEQRALASETTRYQNLLDGGFVSPNEVEQRQARTVAQDAQLQALQAQSLGKHLEVDDCVLRAPFAGEVSVRAADPGAFVRPGSAIVTLVDRHMLRLVADAPETDFDAVSVGTIVNIMLLSNGLHLQGAISRRAPAADETTRTVRFEVDLDPAGHDLPAGTTAEINLDVGAPRPATMIPSVAAKARGNKASVFVVDGNVAKKLEVPLLGEREGQLFVAPELAPETLVVTEGRAHLANGDRVLVKDSIEGAAKAP
ncbi:MAG TPA: efflux RND transporter periplasmic adaptor subunit [Polyangiaceae bacterium]|nr:efflux RND transporter periplasmic adaptor subunit [Polyangiaceae bacterium]